MKTKHGVLVDNGQICYPGEIAEKALHYGYTHVWMMGDIEVAKPENHGDFSFQVSERKKKPATVSVWKRGTGHVNIIFLDNTAWVEGTKAFKDVTPAQLLDAVNTVESSLGITIAGSPGGAGWGLLKKLHPEWIENIPVNLRDMHFIPKSGPDLIWQHKDLAHFPGIKYIHKFDKGAAYPAAGTQTDIGKGTPVHLAGADAWRAAQHEKGHPQEVGVWNCHVTCMAIPDFTPFNPIPSGDYWLAGPRIRMLEAAGYSVEPFEGYVFPERHDVLVKWAKVLWEKRNEATNPIVKKMFKQIANSTVGFTAFHGFEDEEEEKRRPDIRLQVVSRNAEIMFHNIEKVRREQHESPCMVYMDAVYYFSLAEDGRAAFPSLVEREGKLGGFKYEGRIEIIPDVSKMFTMKMSVADRLEVLNKIGWVQ